MRGMDVAALRAKIRDIKDFPTEGILFKDITTLLRDGPAWRFAVDSLASRYQADRVDVVVGVESRGFIFGGAIAHQLPMTARHAPAIREALRRNSADRIQRQVRARAHRSC